MLLLPLSAAAQQLAPVPIPPGLPGSGSDATPPGTISWSVLGKARTVQRADKRTGPQYTPEIKALNGQNVKLYGFMMPLDGGSRKQKRFLLVAWPPHCSFCMPGGPELMAEVLADKPIDYSIEPVILAGKLQVLEDDIVYYRLTGASLVRL